MQTTKFCNKHPNEKIPENVSNNYLLVLQYVHTKFFLGSNPIALGG
jgi:hypothetical protein